MTLEEWRTEYGLPVQLVVVGHIAPNTLPSNAHVRYVTPCRYTWLKTFWKTLLSNSESPCPIASSDMLSQLVYRYRIEHRSLSMFMEELQLNVTYFYTPPASFVWDALELHPSFLAWFGVHGTAKKWLSLKSGASKFTALQECQQFQHQIKWWWSLQMHLLPLLMDERTIPNDFLSVLAELYHAVRECDPKAPPLPPDVGRYWNRKSADLTKTPDSELSSEQKRAQGLIYELILVVGHYLRGTTEDDAVKLSSKEQMDGMQRMLHELFEFCEERMAKLQDKWNQNNPLSKRASSSGQTIDHGPCHHRQKLVDGLMSPSKELYGLLEDRLSIPREEWLYDFGGSPEDFMRGVWSLVVLGLVQAKSKRGGNKGTTVYYEKVSVVWC